MLVRTDDMPLHDYKYDITRNEIIIIRSLYNASTNLKDRSKSESLPSNIVMTRAIIICGKIQSWNPFENNVIIIIPLQDGNKMHLQDDRDKSDLEYNFNGTAAHYVDKK